MRALLHFIFISLFLVSDANAVTKVLFEEDFDNIPGSTAGGTGTYSFPSGWTLANVDNNTPASIVYNYNDAWIRRESFENELDTVAVSNSYSDVLFSIEAENSSWMSRDISLNNYKGQTVYIGFRNNTEDNFLLLIDDVVVEEVPITPSTANVLYVNKNVSGGDGSGDSWANAVPELADALLWANDHQNPAWATTPLQIWVAGGTYKPLYSPQDGLNFGTNQDRYNSFLLVKDVQLYGGFAGTETALSQRDLSVTANASVLSGDIGTPNNSSDNTCHVVVSAGDVGSALLNGFTVTGGNANGMDAIYVNGLLFIPTDGGGLCFINSSPRIVNTIINYNTALFGGGMLCKGASPNLINVLQASNTASNIGGAICNEQSSTNLTNVTIIGNTADLDADAIYNISNSNYSINNSIIWGEVTNSDGGSFTLNNNSLIQNAGNTANGNIDATGLTAEDIFTDPANGDYTLKQGSPAINLGNDTLYTDAGGSLTNDKDLAGNPRRVYGPVDIGAYENQGIELQPDVNNILYVNKNVSGGDGSGDSWANAVPELANALRWANDNQNPAWATTPLQIWVARGTYTPLYNMVNYTSEYGSNDGRENTFLLIKNVHLYGGFAGTESVLSQRDLSIAGNTSILDGDIGVPGNNSDNTYHVLVSPEDVVNASIDGFTVTNGNANSSSFNYYQGGGIEVWNDNGGGIYILVSSVVLTNVNFTANYSKHSGAAIFMDGDGANLVMQNSIIAGNHSTNGISGGLYKGWGTFKLVNLTLADNTDSNLNYSIYSGGEPSLLNNCIVWGASQNSSSSSVNNLILGNSNTANGNIDATGLTTEDIFQTLPTEITL